MSLQGKIALVTGASRAIALRLAKDGAAVVVNYAGSEQQAHEVVADIEKAGGKAVAMRADVSRVADVVRLFDATLERFGRLNILVNNAGVILYKLLADTTEEKRRFGQMAALGRLGQPHDIADVVALLASDDAHWITGQNVRANGGTI